MNAKFQFILAATLSILIVSCNDSEGLNRKLKGKYDIVLMEETLQATGNCNGDYPIDDVILSVNNPGRIVFTNDKVIQGSPQLNKSRPYLGYFEYDVNAINYYGDTVVFTNPEYFQYAFNTITSGNDDTIKAFIYMHNTKDELELQFNEDDKGNIIELIQYERGGQCYINHRITHYVKN